MSIWDRMAEIDRRLGRMWLGAEVGNSSDDEGVFDEEDIIRDYTEEPLVLGYSKSPADILVLKLHIASREFEETNDAVHKDALRAVRREYKAYAKNVLDALRIYQSNVGRMSHSQFLLDTNAEHQRIAQNEWGILKAYWKLIEERLIQQLDL